jgi:monoamine oxidase
VLAIEQPAGRVRVRYRDASGVHETEGHYAICTLPLTVLGLCRWTSRPRCAGVP